MIRTARPDERHAVEAVFQLAFGSDPTFRWLWPNPADYMVQFPRFVEALGGAPSYEHETAFVAEGYRGATQWLPPGVAPDGEAAYEILTGTTSPAIRRDVEHVGEQLGLSHIHEPHWYLAAIGVEPTHHGQGLGAQLLDHTLAACDRDGLPAYLESSNPRNISLYRRHGFEAVGEIQAGDSPVITPMVRPAQVR